MKSFLVHIVYIVLVTSACAKNDTTVSETNNPIPDGTEAVITDVSVTGNENNYTFSVTIKSPDQGCNQYADWWEVISEDEALIYRRILGHSHVNEQPFTRSGGSVNITQDTIVYVRAHMNNKGYGTIVFKGSASGGFSEVTLETSFASALETAAPLPNGCAF